ncbi:MAG TPA: FKBP-type peptidyl-prolyl cis-trans isomerase [Candidatus Paceibacterota bacterium]|nr:FKBP-type peptidyl-prolyl cis-trans isomerase [Candidatus Paceibacterota bacterium]
MNTKTVVIGVILIIIIAAGLYFIIGSSSSSNTAGSNNPPTSGTTTQSTSTPQVQAEDVSVGSGAQAEPNDTVSVLYVGYLGQISSSTIFDSSAAHGNKPYTFTLGDPQGPIAGFQIGVNGMKVGGQRIMAIPPSLGYGAIAVHQNPSDPNTPVVIPANSTLIFQVQLVSVQPASTTHATTDTATH